MRPSKFLLISLAYCARNFGTVNKKISNLENSNFLLSKKFVDSVVGVCQDNKNHAIVLLLDKNMDFEMQCFLFDIDEKALLNILQTNSIFLYKYTEISNVINSLSNLKQQYKSHEIQFCEKSSLEVKKGRLCIIFKEDFISHIDKTACDLIKDTAVTEKQYIPIKNLILGNKWGSNVGKKVFLLKTHLLHYVCAILKQYFCLFMDDSKNNLYHYILIQENLKIVLNLLTNFDSKIAINRNKQYLNILGPFFKAIYGNEYFEMEDVEFHEHFRITIFIQNTALKFNQLKIVTKEDDVHIRKGFIEHILICVRKFLTIRLNS